MGEFFSPQSAAICYNVRVPQKRGRLIFDIGGRLIALAVGPTTVRSEGKTPETAGWFRKNRRHSGELRKRILRPQCVRNSVLVLPRKPLLSRTRQEYGVAPYVQYMRRNLFSYASSRLVVVPLGNRVSRVRRFSFRAKAAALGRTGAEGD